jgi:hypothetical protein
LAAAAAVCVAACGSTPAPTGTDDGGTVSEEIPLRIDHSCPGDPNCPDTGDGKLYVGAAKRDVTPLVEPFIDTNGNGEHDPSEPFTDLNGDGKFNPVFLAGRDNGRLAYGVHDPLWVRCWAVKVNETLVANCAIDCVGYFEDEEEQIRADLDPQLGVDLLIMSATHDHQAQDTTGLWGIDLTTSGYDPAFMARLREASVDAITEAVKGLKPATMKIGSIATEDPDKNMIHYVNDTRDPVIIDNRLHIMQFDGVDGKPIVTVINWASHPDSLGSDNHYISSDFVHYMRESVSAGTGSDVVFVNASQGGQIGPGNVTPYYSDGSLLTPHEGTYHFIDVWGQEIARLALMALDSGKVVDSPKLAFRHTTFNVHVENIAYQTAARLKLFGNKAFFGYVPGIPLLGDNEPQTQTEVAYLTLGPASIITAPGELLPELFVGGYDGSHSGTYTIVDTSKPNAADLTKAPKPPYLFDLMDGDPENRMVWGLSLDFLGYIVAQFNFVLNPDLPYLARADGDHYEETNSIGPTAEPEIVGTMRQLITFGRPKN